jgi:hypothetical protein
VYTILAAGVAISAAAMVISPQTLVFVAGGICCAKYVEVFPCASM